MSAGGSEVAGVVLVGGASRRMGRPKWDLPFGDGTLLDWSLRLARTAVDEVWVSVARPIAISPAAAGVIVDSPAGLGPLGALRSAMRALARPVLLLAADLPFVSPDDLGELARSPAGADALLLRDEDGHQPLAALYRVSLLPLIEEQIAAREYAMRSFLDRVPYQTRRARERIPGCPPLANLNTPAQYAAALRVAAARGLIPPPGAAPSA